MTDPAERVVRALADGRSRDRACLVCACAMDEAAFDEALDRLSRIGVVLAVGRDTVALPHPVDLLDPERILRSVPRLSPGAVHVRFTVDSTNTVLAERLREGAGAPELCAAEIQTAGRGRRGRRWVSGLGQSLVLSVSWRFTMRPGGLSGLPLAVGVALVEALAAGGFDGAMLKWPNDLIVDDRKLAGILVEASQARPDSAACVVGVGFNLDLAQGLMRAGFDRIGQPRIGQPWIGQPRIGQPWTDFARAFGRVPARNALASRSANAILDACEQYRDHGLARFAARWEGLDALRGRPVRVLSAGTPLEGVARGIDAGGALLVEHAAGLTRCDAGEVRVRTSRKPRRGCP